MIVLSRGKIQVIKNPTCPQGLTVGMGVLDVDVAVVDFVVVMIVVDVIVPVEVVDGVAVLKGLKHWEKYGFEYMQTHPETHVVPPDQPIPPH